MSESSAQLHGASPKEAAAQPKGGLGKAAVGGATWTLVGFGAGQLIRMVGNMALARFVAPEAFGIMALVTVTMQGLHMMSDVGIGTAIVQHKRGSDETFLRTAWTLGIIRGCIIALIGCLLAYPIARFNNQPILAPLIICSGLTMILHGGMSTSLFVASRDLKVSRVITIELVVSLSVTVVMVALGALYALLIPAFSALALQPWMPQSLASFSGNTLTNPVWAVMAGVVTAAIVRFALSYTLIPSIKHFWCWDETSRKELIRFGRWVMLGTLLTFLTNQLDRFMLPKLLKDFGLFGLYSIALNFASLPMDVLQRLGTQVLFPVYSRLARENRFSSEVYARVSFIILTLGALAVAGLVAVAPGFIQTFYKPEYHDVAIILQIFSVVVWLRVLQYNSSSALLALGDTKVQASSNGVKLVCLFAFVLGGFYLGKHLSTQPLAGLVGAIAGIAIAELGKYGILAYSFARGDWRRLKPDIKATLELLAVCAVVVGVHIVTRKLSPWLDMILSGSVVMLMYSAVMYRALAMVGPHLPMKLPGPLARFQRVQPTPSGAALPKAGGAT